MKSNLHTIQRENAPIYIRYTFNAGSRYDTKPGIAHFLEHMLVAGTKNYPSKDALAEYIESIGGSFSASTSGDAIRINVEIAEKEDLEIATTVLSEILHHSNFNEQVFEKERGSIIAELQKKKSNPNEYVWEVYRRLFFQETSLEQSTLGSVNSIKSITLTDLKDFKEKYIQPQLASIIASGDIDSPTLELALTASNIVSSEKISDKSLELVPIIRNKKIDVEVYSGEQVSFVFGCRTIVPTLQERAALNLILTYLVGGRASKLISELRYKKGLIYSISGGYMTGADWGTLVINSSCNVKDIQEVLKIILDEIKSLQTTKLFQEKLDFLKSKIIKSYKIRLQTSHSVVESSETGFLSREQYSIKDYIQAIKALTTEDVQNIVQKHINTNMFYCAMCGPESLKSVTF